MAINIAYCLCCVSYISYKRPYIIHYRDTDGLLTYVSRGATGGRHDVALHYLGEPKITDHDLGVLILAEVQDVLWLHRGGQTDRRAVHTLMFSMNNFSKCCISLSVKITLL